MPTVGCELCKLTVHHCLVAILNISEVLNSWAADRNTKQEIAQDLKSSQGGAELLIHECVLS